MPVVKKAAVKKAVASKKAPAKKATAAKKTSATTEETSAREARKAENMALAERIVELRENDNNWATISEETGVGQGKAMLLYMYATTDDADKINLTGNEDKDGPKIVKARESGLSWGNIMARTGVGEGKLRALFEAASGESTMGNRIGKGGRYPTGSAPAKKVGKAVGKTAKASKAAKAAEAESVSGVELPPAGTPIAEFTLAQLKKRMNGKTVTLNKSSGGVERIKVKSVTKKSKAGEISLVNQDGASRTILAVSVKAITK